MSKELIDRLEKAEEGAREFDCRIHGATDLVDGEHWTANDVEIACEDPDRTANPPHYTTSLDAALALAERVLPGWIGSVHFGDGSGTAFLAPPDRDLGGGMFASASLMGQPDVEADGKTPALALCIAILKAQGAQQ